ncbi:MAG: hypothetical protein DHS20C17_07760 [Cyclobacteriaceae bacterium]|nr:MAG: hypothetical protein DHS20C17_07760 [Cyclobacteriaceae bacterium]
MSKYSKYSEQIASYLDGQMNPGEMQQFEKQLHTDPLMRSEFELQQDIIHNLRDFRKTQLKTRLDQVPVGMGPTAMIGMKAAAALVISGIIGVGTYLYFTTPAEDAVLVNETELVTESIESTDEPVTVITEALPEVSTDQQETSTKEPLIIEPKIAETKRETVREPVKENTVLPSEEKVPVEENIAPVINSPKLMTPILEDTGFEESIQIPSAGLAQDGLADNSVVAVETARKDADMFHYQYFSGKLYLYGDFRDNPYEILELNSTKGKRLFIYYNGDYYRIIDGQQQITPLEKLTDHDIIKKLEIIQANK